MSNKDRRRVAVVLVDRANYGRLWPVMKAIEAHSGLELLTVCAGTMLLDRFGHAERIVENEGFRIASRVYMELEGSQPATMAKSIGLGIIEFTGEFQRLQPDVVLLIGDRYEALAAAIASAYMNIPIAHVQGGEVSGSIDECARHAITRFAHLHFPATRRAADYLVRMGERPDSVHAVGCPAGDYIRPLETDLPPDLMAKLGVGPALDISKPFFLVIYHPVTTQFGTERANAEELLQSLHELAHPTIWIWPNIDAGADDISKALRVYRESHSNKWLHLVKNLDPTTFQKCLKRTVCAIGNSSSFIRDSTFTGTPVVLVGNRQVGREYGENLVQCRADREDILRVIRAQLAHGRYPPSDLYGSGDSARQICEALASFSFPRQKHLNYIMDGRSA